MTFDNGVMVSSLKELRGVLEIMDDGIFKVHVNKNKNDIADWIGKNFSKEKGEKLKSVIDRKILMEEIENMGKTKKQEVEKEGKD